MPLAEFHSTLKCQTLLRNTGETSTLLEGEPTIGPGGQGHTRIISNEFHLVILTARGSLEKL